MLADNSKIKFNQDASGSYDVNLNGKQYTIQTNSAIIENDYKADVKIARILHTWLGPESYDGQHFTVSENKINQNKVDSLCFKGSLRGVHVRFGCMPDIVGRT